MKNKIGRLGHHYGGTQGWGYESIEIQIIDWRLSLFRAATKIISNVICFQKIFFLELILWAEYQGAECKEQEHCSTNLKTKGYLLFAYQVLQIRTDCHIVIII